MTSPATPPSMISAKGSTTPRVYAHGDGPKTRRAPAAESNATGARPPVSGREARYVCQALGLMLCIRRSA
jgi:hypothetical protein